MRPERLGQFATAGAALLVSASAFAHTGADAGVHHGLGAGFLHPFSGLDHLVALMTLGLWSGTRGQTGLGRNIAVPLTFALALLAGALLSTAGLALPAIEPMIAASLLVFGLALSVRGAPQAPLALACSALFGIAHGAAHGLALAGAAQVTGMLAGSALLLLAGYRLGAAARTRSARWPRLAGLLAAALGLGLFATLARI